MRFAQELTPLVAVNVKGWKGRCPLCRAELLRGYEANELFRCFGGNVVVLIMLSRQLRYDDAVDWLRLHEQ